MAARSCNMPSIDARSVPCCAGAIAAAVVGFVHMACGARFGGSLIVFYLTGSRVRGCACVVHPHYLVLL